MPTQTVQVAIGPVDAQIALEWVRHWQDALVRIVESRERLSIVLEEPQLERLGEILAEWRATAEGSPTFWWRLVTTADELEAVIEPWLLVGQLAEADFELLGIEWAPESTLPMSDAVVTGVSAALVTLGDRGAELRGQMHR